MFAFILRRLAVAVPTLLLLIVFSFVLMSLAPGGPFTGERALPPADRPRGFGVVFTGSSIGAAIAAPLASQLAKHFGFRTAFFGTAAVGLLWIPVWLTFAFRAPARAAPH